MITTMATQRHSYKDDENPALHAVGPPWEAIQKATEGRLLRSAPPSDRPTMPLSERTCPGLYAGLSTRLRVVSASFVALSFSFVE